jgi:hypothetical protein
MNSDPIGRCNCRASWGETRHRVAKGSVRYGQQKGVKCRPTVNLEAGLRGVCDMVNKKA